MSGMIIGRGSEVVARFQPRIRWISESVAVAFGNQVDAEDLRQEAVILVLSYAGVAEGWHHDKLSAWERIAGGDEARVNALLARTLRLDLSRMTGRSLERAIAATSLHTISPGEEPYDSGFEDRVIDRMRHGMAALRSKYPTLVRHFIDGCKERDIAADEGVSVAAIWKRTAKEKAALARAHGIPVGDLTSAA
jgi:DNA-directed RNA polymerase specialized sigma24 family protein